MKMNDVFDYLDELFPDAKCELNYNNDIEFLISVVLSAQTTDKKVNKVTEKLFSKYDVNSLKDADITDLENILKPLGMSNKKAEYIKDICYDLVNKYNMTVPKNKKDLMSMKGVGNKTANLVLATLYNKPYLAVDTHVSRVSKRLDLVGKNDDVLQIEKKLYKLIPKSRISKTHHQLVLFGRYYCKSVKPSCENCKLKNMCKREN